MLSHIYIYAHILYRYNELFVASGILFCLKGAKQTRQEKKVSNAQGQQVSTSWEGFEQDAPGGASTLLLS